MPFSTRVEVALSRDSRPMPTVPMAVPRIGKILYRPVADTIRPDPIEDTSSPPTNGSMSRPETVALTPSTVCRKKPM